MCAQPSRTTKICCDDLILKGIYYDLYSTTHITMKKFIQRYSKPLFGKEKHVLTSADTEYLCRFGILAHDNKVFSAISFVNSHIYTTEFVSYLAKFGPNTFHKRAMSASADDEDEDEDALDVFGEDEGFTQHYENEERRPYAPSMFKRPATPTPTLQNILGSTANPSASFIVKIPTATVATPTEQEASASKPPLVETVPRKRPAAPSTSKKPMSKLLKLANSAQK